MKITNIFTSKIKISVLGVDHKSKKDLIKLRRLISESSKKESVFLIEYDKKRYNDHKKKLKEFCLEYFLVNELIAKKRQYKFIDNAALNLMDKFYTEVSLRELVALLIKKNIKKHYKFYKYVVKEREEKMISNIKKYVYSLNKKEYFIVVGKNHLNSIKKELKKIYE